MGRDKLRIRTDGCYIGAIAIHTRERQSKGG